MKTEYEKKNVNTTMIWYILKSLGGPRLDGPVCSNFRKLVVLLQRDLLEESFLRKSLWN